MYMWRMHKLGDHPSRYFKGIRLPQVTASLNSNKNTIVPHFNSILHIRARQWMKLLDIC